MKQRRYMEAIERHDLVFGIGPAGTGKTYLAVAMAVSALLSKRVSRIILTRPAVEAGERLGFLPGTLQEKVDPYLRPLYDALYDMLEADKVEKLLERNIIEVAPIAFMRGRTLNDSFIILDEAQNSTPEQMKMILTRQGFNSKMVVTGDITQIDLPTGQRSGLLEAIDVLRGVEGISFVSVSTTATWCGTVWCRASCKAYERYNETIGAGRQLSLSLADNAAERTAGSRGRAHWLPAPTAHRKARRLRAFLMPDSEPPVLFRLRRAPAGLRRRPSKSSRGARGAVAGGRASSACLPTTANCGG